MTDERQRPGRVDLRALEAHRDAHRADRVIEAAMARISALPVASRSVGVIESLGSYLRPVAVAAAVLLMLATGAVLATDDLPSESRAIATLANWAESGHVPTNGELLVAFQGYGR